MTTLDEHSAVWCGHLGQAPLLTHRAEIEYYAASLMKLPLLLAAYRLADRGELDLDEPVRVHAEFTSVLGGQFSLEREEDNDELPWRWLGERVTLGWLCSRMIIASSNLAANLVLERLGVAAVEPVCPNGMLVRRGIGDVAGARAGISNTVTAASVAELLAECARDARLLDILERSEYRACIPAALPEGVRVGNKSGWVDGLLHDAAVPRPAHGPPALLVICTEGLEESLAMKRIHAITERGWALLAEEERHGHH